MENEKVQEEKTAEQLEDTRFTISSEDSYIEAAVARFKLEPAIAKSHNTAQRKYNTFCKNRNASLYTTFYNLDVVGGAPDFKNTTFVQEFKACAPFPGRTNLRPVSGMAKKGSIMHGLVRFNYKGNIIEECRKNGKEHGLRVTCTQMGDIWIRLYSNGKRLAQIVLSPGYSIAEMPRPIDDGGLKDLMSHLDLILECFGVVSTNN
mmetsp:Transcript_6920/g.12733  ORF Transcript_6920/g.12733 Transcript_6920/m.12733 type:complete len:205 (-) Transcript_6920:120-734(-)|eukprot:CAMPEP_0197524138 /NCGR_PEP_ID=MMETSP1318-20131121/8894_1 /TAXON_ID=552666 /ORGANISM="Partenskyella glossopodia, Strain RCC365" /LENGTH=204 /DNA_ID=CAMNT_0043077021 /DNA_START=131 /DNA_END=745 /DNA_ORIENTATION=+